MRSLISCLAVLLVLPAAGQQRADCPPERQLAEAHERFRGPLLVGSTEGAAQSCVVMETWQIANESKTEIPHRGFLIVQLRAGSLETETERDERQKWSEGSFWSVPPDQVLIIHTGRDSVILQTVDFIMEESALDSEGGPGGLTSPP